MASENAALDPMWVTIQEKTQRPSENAALDAKLKLNGWRGYVVHALEDMYPLHLAEPWDNVGLLIDDLGDDSKEDKQKKTVMVTNDLTEVTLAEAMSKGATLIITYHPRPFGKFNRLTRTDATQRIVLRCVRAGIAVYSPHTACDNAQNGVNDWLAAGLAQGACIKPVKLLPPAQARQLTGVGSGRMFTLFDAVSLGDFVKLVKQHLKLSHVRVALANSLLTRACGDLHRAMEAPAEVKSVAVQAGSGAGTLSGCGAGVWVTGEASHHEVLEANANGTTVILTDHSNTERGFLPHMCTTLLAKEGLKDYEGLDIFVSVSDSDPLHVV